MRPCSLGFWIGTEKKFVEAVKHSREGEICSLNFDAPKWSPVKTIENRT